MTMRSFSLVGCDILIASLRMVGNSCVCKGKYGVWISFKLFIRAKIYILYLHIYIAHYTYIYIAPRIYINAYEISSTDSNHFRFTIADICVTYPLFLASGDTFIKGIDLKDKFQPYTLTYLQRYRYIHSHLLLCQFSQMIYTYILTQNDKSARIHWCEKA